MKLLRLLSILLLTCNFAIAQISQQTIVDEITANLPTNNRNEISAELLRNTLNQMTSAIFQNQGLSGLTITGTPTIGQTIIATSSSTASWQTIGGGQVTTVTNADGSLLISPTTGNVVGSLNVGHANTWLALQNFSAGGTSLTLTSIDNSTNIATTAFVQTVVSTSAPSTLTFALPLTLANAIIPASVSSAFITAMANSGTSTCGLNFNKGNSTPTGIYGEILNGPSNIYWEPQYMNSPVQACQFGTVADASYSQVTGIVTGTDNTSMIQATINYALQNIYNVVCINDGIYKTTDTIQQGWGGSFAQIALQSCDTGRASYSPGLAGVTIVPTATDRCALNIQGGRNIAVRGIAFWGQAYPFISNIVFSGPAINGPAFPLTAAGWFPPALTPTGSNPGGLQRHSPYAAICIDAYSNAQPADHYPTVTYPAFTGIVTQYNKVNSSDIEITNVETSGFAVGINSHPNGDGNGDYIKIDKLSCSGTTYCVSISNSQSRNPQITNVNYAFNYAVLTNNTFGDQVGFLGGMMDTWIGGQGYQIYQIGALNSGANIKFSNQYFEATVKIGTVTNGGGFSQSILMDGCFFDLAGILTFQLPPSLLTIVGGPISVKFQNCGIAHNARIDALTFGQTNVTIDGGIFLNGDNLAQFNQTGIMLATNFTGGVLVGGAITNEIYPNNSKLIWQGPTMAKYTTTPSGSALSQQMGLDADFTTFPSRAPLTQATTGFVDASQHRWQFSSNPINSLINIGNSSFTSINAAYTSCDIVTFTYLAVFQTGGNSQTFALAVGDILKFTTDGTLFVITTIGSADGSGNFPITMQQMNNMTLSDNVNALCATSLTNPSSLNGNTQVIHTNVPNIPNIVFYGDFIKGSTSVTNITSGGTGSGTALATYVQNADVLWSYPPTVNDLSLGPISSSNVLSSVTAGATGSLTLSRAALTTGRYPIVPLPVVGVGTFGTQQIIPISAGGTAQSQATTAFQVTGPSNAAEANIQAICPAQGQFSKLFMQATAPASGQTIISTLRINGSGTSIGCTITGPGATCSDVAHTATCTAGQSYSISTVTSATTGSITALSGGIQLTLSPN